MSVTEKKTVLIVDDETFNIVVLSDLLKVDYRIIVAKNGDQALRKVRISPLASQAFSPMWNQGASLQACRDLSKRSNTECASD